MKKIWKKIKNQPNYIISNYGDIQNIKTGHITHHPTYFTFVYNNKKTRKNVMALVVDTFLKDKTPLLNVIINRTNYNYMKEYKAKKIKEEKNPIRKTRYICHYNSFLKYQKMQDDNIKKSIKNTNQKFKNRPEYDILDKEDYISELGTISSRTFTVLLSSDIKQLKDLEGKSLKDLHDIKNLGFKMCVDIMKGWLIEQKHKIYYHDKLLTNNDIENIKCYSYPDREQVKFEW